MGQLTGWVVTPQDVNTTAKTNDDTDGAEKNAKRTPRYLVGKTHRQDSHEETDNFLLARSRLRRRCQHHRLTVSVESNLRIPNYLETLYFYTASNRYVIIVIT